MSIYGSPYIGSIKFEENYFVYCFDNVFVRGNASLYDIDAYSIQTIPNPDDLLDENGGKLVFDNPIETGVLTWRKGDGSKIILPFYYPRFLDGREVVPLMHWGKGENKRIVSGWQVWLVNRQTGEVVKKFEHPFVTLQPGETIVFDQISGYFQVVKRAGDAEVPTGVSFAGPLTKPQLSDGDVDGIRFYGGFKQQDIVFYGQLFDWIKLKSPKWYEYIIQNQPFVVIYDPSRDSATGNCCDSLGRGRVTIPGLIGNANLKNLTEGQIMADASLFIHEVTHVRDGRGGKLKLKGTKQDCQFNESSAVKQQVTFLNDLISVMPEQESQIKAQIAANNQYAVDVPLCGK